MSFRFNEQTFKDNSFNERMKEKLTKAFNSHSNSSEGKTDNEGGLSNKSSKLDILKSAIIVRNVCFPTIPEFEILDLDISAPPRSLAKGICKISCKDAMLEIQTEIESNLLLLYIDNSPSFTTPDMICNDSFTIPITMTFSKIQLEAITNLFVKNSGISISFNDVELDFHFDCSIKILQSSIAKRLKNSMQLVFKDVLPRVIFSMSQCWFTQETNAHSYETSNDMHPNSSQLQLPGPRIILDETDLQDLSPANMLRLSTLISSRQTLSLHSNVVSTLPTTPGCLERQNLHRFNSRIPSLSNYYKNSLQDNKKSIISRNNLIPLNRQSTDSITTTTGRYCKENHNLLPSEVLNDKSYELNKIIAIQTRIYERSEDHISPRRRKIKIKNNKNKKRETTPADTTLNIIPHNETACSSRENTVSNSETTVISLASTKLIHNPSIDNSIDPLQLLIPHTDNETHRKSMTNPLLKPNYLFDQSELANIRSSLYSPLCNPLKEDYKIRSPLKDNRRFSFVGLNHQNGWKWGNEESPPPYY